MISRLVSTLSRWFFRDIRSDFPEKTKAPVGGIYPILEVYKSRSSTERGFVDISHSSGFVAADGALRVFYNELGVAVEVEVYGTTISLRDAYPFPQNRKWELADCLIANWLVRHGSPLKTRYSWANNLWH